MAQDEKTKTPDQQSQNPTQDQVDVTAMQAENERLKNELAERDRQMNELAEREQEARERQPSQTPEGDNILEGSVAGTSEGLTLASLGEARRMQIVRDNMRAQTLNLDVAPKGGRFLNTSGKLVDVNGKVVREK